MSAANRRKAGWVSLGGVFVLLVGLVVAQFLPSVTARASDPEPPAALDLVTLDRMHAFRRDLGLGNDGLAVLDLSAGQLDTLLAGLRSWYEGNASAIVTKRAAVAEKRGALRRLQNARARGEDVASQIEGANTLLTTAVSEWDALIASAKATVLQGLTENQRSRLAAVQSNGDTPMPYRLLALSTEQRTAIRALWGNYNQRISTLRDNETRASAMSDFQAARPDAIGSENETELGNLQGAWAASSTRVVAALLRNFPAAEEAVVK